MKLFSESHGKKKEKLWRGPIVTRTQAEQIVLNAANGFLTFYIIGLIGIFSSHSFKVETLAIFGLVILSALLLRFRHSLIAAWLLLVFSISSFAFVIVAAVLYVVQFDIDVNVGSLVLGVGLLGLLLLATYRAHTAIIKLKKNDFVDSSPEQSTCYTDGESK